MRIYIYSALATIVQLAIFTGLWYYYWSHPTFKCPCLKYQQSFPVAKASAMLININLFMMLMSYIQLWRRFIYISQYTVSFLHKYFVIGFSSWSVVHVVAHYINFLKTNTVNELFSWGVGLSGNIMALFIMILVLVSSFKKSLNYSVYLVIHYSIVFVLISLIIIHGTFCTIKYDQNTCPPSTTWIWLSIPLTITLLEIVYKYLFNQVYIKRFINHNDNILELQLPLPKHYCGKTIWVNCTSINPFEWHPFTVNKWNSYHNTCSIHVKVRGDWTLKLYNKLQDDYKSVNLLTNGPYYCLPKNFLNNITNNPTLLISTGIGITNFIYPLQTMSKNLSMIKSKITIIIIVKSPNEINFLLNILSTLKNNIEFIFYFTEVSNNSFPFEYRLGRPQFENILDYLLLQTIFTKNTKINIYYSGLNIKHIQQASEQNEMFRY
jgi:hypothetical protein